MRFPLIFLWITSLNALPTERSLDREQKPLRVDGPENHQRPFDAAENSVGLQLSSHDGTMVHLWMPLGKRVFVRESLTLPSRPDTARITTLIKSEPKLATPEQLERVQCEASTANNRTEGRAKGRREACKVSFSKKNGLVKFSDRDGPGKQWWLGNKEVESFKCS